MIISMLIFIIPLVTYGMATDISSHWAETVISQWIGKGLAKGYPDGTFRPENPITRAEFMALVNNAFQFSEEVDIAFIDVAEDDWYFKTIKKAKAAGYIQGFPDGTIKPNNKITRQEVAVIIARLKELDTNEGGASSFKDVDAIDHWSKGYIGAVTISGYMSGYPDGTFSPQKHITRGEALYALNNVIDSGVVALSEEHLLNAVAKQDFLGITYIHVELAEVAKASVVRANDMDLTYDEGDGKWKGTTLGLNVGDVVEIFITAEGAEVTRQVMVKNMTD